MMLTALTIKKNMFTRCGHEKIVDLITCVLAKQTGNLQKTALTSKLGPRKKFIQYGRRLVGSRKFRHRDQEDVAHQVTSMEMNKHINVISLF